MQKNVLEADTNRPLGLNNVTPLNCVIFKHISKKYKQQISTSSTTLTSDTISITFKYNSNLIENLVKYISLTSLASTVDFLSVHELLSNK